ncbi:MAG TPA: sugar phosphate isomerase/epimerase [Anaerolineae bacterium]|nr:sugar phosphate isomerase/epimerase [Anaerolineae bacterium]
MATIPIAFSTGSLYTYGIGRVFDLAARAGFDGVEVLMDHRWDGRHPAYLRRLSRDTGLPILAVHNPFVPHVPGWPADPLSRLRASAAVARAVDAPLVVAHLPLRIMALKVELFGVHRNPPLLPLPFPMRDGEYRRLLLEGLPAFEAEEGVRVGVENMPAKRFLGCRLDVHALNDLETLASLPHLTLDTTHLATWGLDVVEVYRRWRERVIHVHLSNFSGGREHLLPSQGQVPVAGFLRLLSEDGYSGCVSVELHPEALEAEDEGKVLEHLRRELAFCRQ